MFFLYLLFTLHAHFSHKMNGFFFFFLHLIRTYFSVPQMKADSVYFRMCSPPVRGL